MCCDILKIDPYLEPYSSDIRLRRDNYEKKRAELAGESESLIPLSESYKYFGIHREDGGWVYREWAPAADAVYLTGDFCSWDLYAHPMTRIGAGVFELHLAGEDSLRVGENIQTVVVCGQEVLRRIPSYATRVVQDPETYLWCAEVDDVISDGFEWTDASFKSQKTPFIYECHIGMSGEGYEVNTYRDFTKNVLPRIKALGYNTIQIMAIMEHPYYGSFGYQVSNFFAASSRYGTARELKDLVNTAHKKGIAVLLDVVHSHAVKNTSEGLNLFDGTEYQYFHAGERGEHPAWGTKLFDYSKNEVLRFLLSNLAFWMDVYHFDGFRFDGVTSMLYHDHGLGSAFTDYSMYFSLNTDTDAVVYLQLANELIHEKNPAALTIAEDMSGMPGMCLPISAGGIGFDYRLNMGLPDLWIKLIKEYKDEDWDMWMLWHELTTSRPKEKRIGYAESHDQALVGDKTIIFRLCDAQMYHSMSIDKESAVIDRGIALHKIIRLLSSTLAGEGYLNFMGNEFGHPEWIDFPREGNGYSYHYCRRQWSLVDDDSLRYKGLALFDRDMIAAEKKYRILTSQTTSRWIHDSDKVLVYTKGKAAFAVNLHPTNSYEGYFIETGALGGYKVMLSTDDAVYGGFDRVDRRYIYEAKKMQDGRIGFLCYLPSRTGIGFVKI